MGRVWRADGPSGPAALKILSVDLAEVRERFELEARALMKLRHPNVVRAVDYGHAEDGTPFIALELLDGESLEEREARSGKLPVAEALAIGRAAAAGLAAAHQLGIVHRDVKPGNIFLESDGGVKVLDFGIAFWSASDGRMPVSRLTQPGTVMGTPSYMAPEQVAGDRDEDVRTDVWGLGAVLYHAIAGREPFHAGDNYLAELTRILTEPPDPLPEEVPDDVEEVILCALSKDREERYQSMTELDAALRAVIQGDAPPSSRRAVAVDLDVMGSLAEEIRLVSALLVDGLDEEQQQLFTDAVRRHGGVGSPLRGGHAVAVFGLDAWQGDEAERAARASLEVRGFVDRIGIGTGKAVRGLSRRAEPAAAAPSGTMTGEAVAAAQKAMVAMETKGQTLRPQAAATVLAQARAPSRVPAPVVACPETQRRLQGGFELLGARVVGIRAGRRVLRPREIAGREIPFVGRDEALDTLIDVIEEAEEKEQAAAILLTGPPGIGKSRLRFELMRWLTEEEAELCSLQARAEVGRSRVPLGVVREMLRRHAEIPEGTDEKRARERIEALVASAELDEELAGPTSEFVGELLGVPFAEGEALRAARADPQLMAERVRLACGDLIEGWTRQGLVLIEVEDAQWADDASLALLRSLLIRHKAKPLVIVVSARPAFLVEHRHFADAIHLELGELSGFDIGLIVEAVLGRSEPAVVERAAGNPYMAEELSLAVRDGDDPSSLPLTVEGAVLARLDKLSPDEKDLLKRAAVLGRRFWREALEALGEPLAGKLLMRLRQRDLVIPGMDSRLHGCDEWIFRQAIVYEVCAGLLTEEQRRNLHRAAAGWLSRRADATAEEVARHFEAADEAGRAALWWLRAVHGAHTRGESRNVCHFAERVLAVGEAANLPAAEALSMHLLRCEAWYWLGQREQLADELAAARKLAEESGGVGEAALAKTWRWQAQHDLRWGNPDDALVAAERATALADASGDLELRVQSRATLAQLLSTRGELERAAEVAGQALELAKQAAGSLIRATAARALAQVEVRRGRLSSSLFYFTMARNLCKEVGALREACLNSIGVAEGLCRLGDYEQAERMLLKTLEPAESLDLRAIAGWLKMHLGLVHHRLGDSAAGLQLVQDAIDAAAALDHAHLQVAALLQRATISSESHRPDAALDAADEASIRAESHDLRWERQHCLTTRAHALVELRRWQEALDACETAGAARQALADTPLPGDVDLALARYDALTGLGREEDARVALEHAWTCLEELKAHVDGEAFAVSFVRRIPAHARVADLHASSPPPERRSRRRIRE